MGFRIEAPKQDGNARFETLKVNLNENNSATRTVVVDEEGRFYYGTGGGSGGVSGTSGTSGTSGQNGTSGSSGTSGTGFNTINSPLQGRLLVSDGSVNAATASANLFYDTGSSTLQITGSLETDNLTVNADTFQFTGSVNISGSLSTDELTVNADVFQFTGSLEVDGGITGSLFGTSSWAVSASWAPEAEQAATASYITASNVYGPYGSNSIISASYAATASSADSFYIRADRFEFTGSIEVDGGITGSLYGTSSWAVSASWAPGVESASYAATASSADSFYIRADRFEFTGSIEVSGSITGSLFGTASFAQTASYALNVPATASWAIRAVTASTADDFLVRGTLTAQTIVAQTITSSTEYVTGSTIFGSQLSDTHQFTGSVNITGSLTTTDLTVLADVFEFTGSVRVSGSITGSLYGTSSWAVSASWAPNSTQAATASYVTASNVYGPYGSNSIISASYAATASSADSFYIRSDVFEFTGSVRVSGSITGSLFGTASYAETASYALNVRSPFPFSGSAVITGSLLISGSPATSYSLDVNGLSRTTTLHVQNLKNPANLSGGNIDFFVVNNPGDAGYQKLTVLAGGSPYSTVLRTSGDGGGSRGMILDASGAGGEIYFGTSNANRWLIAGSYNVSGSGHIFPIGDNLYDIGNRTARVANYYGVRSYISNLLVVTGSANITGSITSSGDIVPGITDTYNLGSSTFKWKDLYLSGSTIYLGNTEIKEVNNKVTALYGFSGSFTGSLLGTSSFTVNAATASSADDFYVRADRFEFTGSVIVDGGITGSLLGTASFAETASYALNVLSTASWAINALTASSADDFYVRADLFEFTGSLKVSGSITGSLFGTSSWAIRAITASYIDPANIPGISGFKLTTGSIDAEVNVTPQNLFLINSGSTEYLNISSSGDTDIYSNLFIVRNFTTKQPVLIVSQSIVQIATQSLDPTGTTQAGSIWFTPYTMYVGLEEDINIIPN